MALLDPLFMDIDEVYSGDEFGLPYRDLIGEGVVDLAGGDFEVTVGAGNSVDVAAGAAWVEGDTNPARQPTYRCINDAAVNLGISPDPSNPRKVLILLQINDEAFTGTGRNADLVALHGVAAASPAEPAVPDSAFVLALIDVPDGAADSSEYTITDRRVAATIGGGGAAVESGEAGSGAVLDVKSVGNPGVTIGTSTEASPTDICTFDAITLDGTTEIEVEVSIPLWDSISSLSNPHVSLWEGATDLGRIGSSMNASGGVDQAPGGTYRCTITPSAGSHTYKIRAWGGGNASAKALAGDGGVGVYRPIVATIKRV